MRETMLASASVGTFDGSYTRPAIIPPLAEVVRQSSSTPA